MTFREHKLTKKITEYQVMGNYGYGWELVHTDTEFRVGLDNLKTYQESGEGRFKLVHAKVDNPDHGRFKYGQKVRTHPATDAHMQGFRYGYVRKVGRTYVTVAWTTDTRQTRKFYPQHLEPLDEAQ